MDAESFTNLDRRPPASRRDFGRTVSYAALAASLGWIARHEREIWKSSSRPKSRPAESLHAAPALPREGHEAHARIDLKDVRGVVESIPDRTFRLVPYNRWPILEIHVHEGERLKFERKNGAFHGGKTLVTQRETPSEIDSFKEDVEIAEIAHHESMLRKELLEVELAKQIDQARTRLDNAQKEVERVQSLYRKNASTEQEVRRATNVAALARSQFDEAEQTRKVKLQLADFEIRRADHASRRAQSEHDLADYKREFSWSRVPVTGGHLENVVVTKIHAARGAIPNEAGRADVWIEVVDDSEVQVRALVEDEQTDALSPGRPVVVSQGTRTYPGTILAICQEVEPDSSRVPVLIRVPNPTFRLRLNATVRVDFTGRGA